MAIALRDPRLYIRSILIASPEPNELQKADIAEVCLSLAAADEALPWLEGSWRDEERRLALQARALVARGDTKQFLEIRRRQWEVSGTWSALEDYLESLSAEQRPAVLEAAKRRAQEADDVLVGLEVLLGLDDLAAADLLIVQRHKELHGRFYRRLSDMLETSSPGNSYWRLR
ncbi:MAG: DUF6880 family protein [Acidobacteriota bacterium]